MITFLQTLWSLLNIGLSVILIIAIYKFYKKHKLKI